jgi:hypothetical protein
MLRKPSIVKPTLLRNRPRVYEPARKASREVA